MEKFYVKRRLTIFCGVSGRRPAVAIDLRSKPILNVLHAWRNNMMESTVKQQWNRHNFVLRSVFLRPRWRKAAELLLLRIMGTLKPSFSRTSFISRSLHFFLFFFHFPFPFLIFLPRILKSLTITLFHMLKKDKWMTDKFSFENEGPSETSKSVVSIYAQTPLSTWMYS